MLDEAAFRALMQRVRAGDGQAATELVRLYEPEIRRAIRIRLADNRLRRLVDSVDIWQSVLHNFFLRAAAGQYDLHNPTELLKLLKTMANNKLIDKARKPEPQYGAPEALDAVAQQGDSPSQVVATDELLHKMRQLLSDDERYLADQRALGREWADIAAERGEKADALRKKLERAMDRVTRQLGIGEG